MIYTGVNEEYLELSTVKDPAHLLHKNVPESTLSILWFTEGQSTIVIDNVPHTFNPGQICCLTEFHSIAINQLGTLRLIRFDRPFYCIIDHDSEVGCKGLLFFGASNVPVIQITPEEQEKFDILWRMFELEVQASEDLKQDMLQMLLKRLLILATRLYKNQELPMMVSSPDQDLIREFNFLVEQHFKSKHTVQAYADLLFKSPKTLSNQFKRIIGKTPLAFIQERRYLEAQRMLMFSNMSIKEIALDLGFEDSQSFSRFIKKQSGKAPSALRNAS